MNSYKLSPLVISLSLFFGFAISTFAADATSDREFRKTVKYDDSYRAAVDSFVEHKKLEKYQPDPVKILTELFEIAERNPAFAPFFQAEKGQKIDVRFSDAWAAITELSFLGLVSIEPDGSDLGQRECKIAGNELATVTRVEADGIEIEVLDGPWMSLSDRCSSLTKGLISKRSFRKAIHTSYACKNIEELDCRKQAKQPVENTFTTSGE